MEKEIWTLHSSVIKELNLRFVCKLVCRAPALALSSDLLLQSWTTTPCFCRKSNCPLKGWGRHYLITAETGIFQTLLPSNIHAWHKGLRKESITESGLFPFHQAKCARCSFWSLRNKNGLENLFTILSKYLSFVKHKKILVHFAFIQSPAGTPSHQCPSLYKATSLPGHQIHKRKLWTIRHTLRAQLMLLQE